MTADGKPDKNHSQNIILMEVVPQTRGSTKDKNSSKNSYIIGGYASHQWKANNSEQGDETCFLFNLTQNLRFNARPGSQYYQKTEIARTSEVTYIRFGTTDLVIKGPHFNEITSMITPANQGSNGDSLSRMDFGGRGNNSMSQGPGQISTVQPSCFSFGNDLMPTNSVSSIVPGY